MTATAAFIVLHLFIVSNAGFEPAVPDTVNDVQARKPLIMAAPVTFKKATGDSISRWELWSDQGEWPSRQPGTISFQLGGLGRNDGFLIRGHESRHQRLFLDGIPVNERIFGSANRKRLPHYSRLAAVYESTGTTRYLSEVNTRRYHVSRPLTFINYEQTIYDYRSTEGLISRNFSPSTNLTISYWGKNESQGYRNNTMGGRNASVTLYHFLNDSWLIEGGGHYSGLQLGEPDGYQMPDMFTFHFNRFEAVPNEMRARSSLRNSLFRATAYRRSSSGQPANTRISAYHDRYRRFHYDDADSSWVQTLTTGISARQTVTAGQFELQGDLYSEWTRIVQDRHYTMEADSWIHSEAKAAASLPLLDRSRLHSWLQAGWRTDGFHDFEAGAGIHVRLFRGISAYGSWARGEQMPLPGHLYWMRPPIQGASGIGNEKLQRIVSGVQWRTGFWDLVGEVHATLQDNPILVGSDSVFVSAGSYTSAGAMAWLSYDGQRIEFSLSGTFQQYTSDNPGILSQLLERSGQRAWTRASFYYKNYIYNRAAFMKAGFHVHASPTMYRSAQYYPAKDYWDPNSWHPSADIVEAQAIPDFIRLDLDMSVRVRSVLFLFRFENVLDNWFQPGYFETAYHPMPPMRFRFGIRWVLRN